MPDQMNSGGRSTKGNYVVGRGRPPKEHQFKPGQSGNPKGRKRKPKSVQAHVQSILSKKVGVKEGGQEKRLTYLQVLVQRIANKALTGDLKAADFIMKLYTSPEFAETDAIDQNTLSAEERAMLDEVIGQLQDEGQAEPATAAGDDTRDAPPPAPECGIASAAPTLNSPEQEEGSDDR